MDWNERLGKWADSMEKAVDKVSDFGAAEVPEYVKELIRWEIANNIMFVVVMIFSAICCCIFGYGIRRFANQRANDKDASADAQGFFAFVYVASYLAQSIVLIVCAVHCYSSVQAATKAYVAPRVVIVEKIAEFAKIGQKK